jgi:hypothetical protein
VLLLLLLILQHPQHHLSTILSLRFPWSTDIVKPH